jgi:hypothetical protein
VFFLCRKLGPAMAVKDTETLQRRRASLNTFLIIFLRIFTCKAGRKETFARLSIRGQFASVSRGDLPNILSHPTFSDNTAAELNISLWNFHVPRLSKNMGVSRPDKLFVFALVVIKRVARGIFSNFPPSPSPQHTLFPNIAIRPFAELSSSFPRVPRILLIYSSSYLSGASLCRQ